MPENDIKINYKDEDKTPADNIKNMEMNKYNNCTEDRAFPFEFKNKNLIDAIIYSEILGKPRCKRRGRWR